MNIALHALAIASALLLMGSGRGMSACESVTRSAVEMPSTFRKITAREEPGQTPAMTYFVVDYYTTAMDGKRMRERVHCSYMRDTEKATPRVISSEPAG